MTHTLVLTHTHTHTHLKQPYVLEPVELQPSLGMLFLAFLQVRRFQ